MKKNYFLPVLFFISCSFFHSQIINIPDANFKQYLISNFDINGDGNIQQSEALKVTYIDCENKNIGSLEGINSFVNLTQLWCGTNLIKTLNVESLPNLRSFSSENSQLELLTLKDLQSLEYINVSNNRLTSLTLFNCVKVTSLSCSFNQLTELNLSNLTLLKSLGCAYNQISSLDITNSSSLQIINCNNNRLTSLDVSNFKELDYLKSDNNLLNYLNVQGCDKLYTLYIDNNFLTSLNLKNLNSLQSVVCNNNLITNLDVDGCKNLYEVSCEFNQIKTFDCRNTPLASLSISNNSLLTSLFVKNGKHTNVLFFVCPNLKYICYDESEKIQIERHMPPGCEANTYCSFTPGLNFNTIKGKVSYDLNGNGCDDNDLTFFPVKFSLLKTNSVANFFTNSTDGTYKTYINEGDYTITPQLENSDYFIFSPPSKNFAFSNSDNNIEIQDFCITPNGIKNDLEVKIIPISSVRPGFDAEFKLIYKNKGNTILNGNLNFAFDPLKSDFISASVSPDSQTIGNLSWNYSNLKPYETKIIDIVTKTKIPPVVNNNDLLVFQSTIFPLDNDLSPDDNEFKLSQTVVGSFDPNDKICLEGSVISSNFIGKYITYKIRFENTGTANAEQVVIKDVIDSSMFDVNSVIPIYASHQYKTRVSENIVEFIFENIDLAFDDANNDGFIVFKIKTLPNLSIGKAIKNKANIYFDYNLPIITNEYSSTFQVLNLEENKYSQTTILIYPNPVHDFLNIETHKKFHSIQIFDYSGKIVMKIITSEKRNNLRDLPRGNYFVKLLYNNGESEMQKIIKN